MAHKIAKRTGTAVITFNEAVPGLTSAGLLRQLHYNTKVIKRVQQADLILLTIGANDLHYQPGCPTTLACYSAAIKGLSRNLRLTVARIARLTAGRPVALTVTDYWNVWQDGAVAAGRGSHYVKTSRLVTAEANRTILRAAARHPGGIPVELVDIFRGQDHDEDDTDLLAADGDHPNAHGHERIAAEIASALATNLH